MNRRLDSRSSSTRRTALLCAAAAGLVLTGCANPDRDAAPSPREYWRPPTDAKSMPSGVGITVKKDVAERVAQGPLDLSSALDIALANNPNTRRFWHTARAQVGQVGVAEKGYYPDLSISGGITRTKNRSVVPGSSTSTPGTTYTTSYGPTLQLNWLLYDFGQREANVEAQRLLLYAANYDYNDQLQQALRDVHLTYYNLGAAESAVAAAQASLEDAQATLRASQERLRSGLGTRQDYLRALASVKDAEYQLQQQYANLESARANFASVLGVPVTGELRIKPLDSTPTAQELDAKVGDLMAEALRQRPDVNSSYSRLRSNSKLVDAAVAQWLPSINATGTGQWSHYEGYRGNPYNNYSAGVSVSWDIFDGFNRKYTILRAKEQEKASREQYRLSEIAAAADVWNRYYGYKTALGQLSSATAKLDASAEALEATRLGYQSGVNSILDLLSAQSTLADARQQKIAAEANLANAMTQLSYSTGTLLLKTPPEKPLSPEQAAEAASKPTPPADYAPQQAAPATPATSAPAPAEAPAKS